MEMQLDLFQDNRRTILMNDAARMLQCLDVEKALALYEELLAENPADVEIMALCEDVNPWRERLCQFEDCSADGLYELYRHLGTCGNGSLRSGIIHLLTDGLQGLPTPELVYVPPRFHVGCMLLEAGRSAGAERWFAAALLSGIGERGRFLSWQGDALTLCGKESSAMECYRAAFFEDPDSIEISAIVNASVRHLMLSLAVECLDDDADDREAAAWLSFWGWLHGVFTLNLNDISSDRDAFVANLQRADDGGESPLPRLWYDWLRYAEYLRTCERDDREMVRVRRRMRELHGGMFAHYMERISGGGGERKCFAKGDKYG